MSIERLFLLDPYNDKHISMIKEFEKENDLSSKISENIGKIRSSISKENYLNKKKELNEISENLFLEKNLKVIDCCYIQGEKDIKTCRITFYPLKNKILKRKLVTYVANYALNTLGMEEVFLNVNSSDKTMINYLNSLGYENLGEENNRIIYLTERIEKKEEQRKIS